MSVAQDAIRRALAALAGDGEGRWAPTITTGQAARQGRLLAAARASNARGNVVESDWLTWYEAGTLPPAADPAWTLVDNGTPTANAASSVLSVTGTATDWAAWYIANSGVSYDPGVVVEARVKVDSADSGADAGAVLGISDGFCAYGLFLRPDGLNVAGFADVPVDLTTYRVVTLEMVNTVVSIYVDGALLTVVPAGYFSDAATAQEVQFGAALLLEGAAAAGFAATASVAHWDRVRFRVR